MQLALSIESSNEGELFARLNYQNSQYELKRYLTGEAFGFE